MLQSVSGKDIGVTAAFRMPSDIYSAAVEKAQQRNVKLSVVLREWVTAGLAADQEPQRAQREEKDR